MKNIVMTGGTAGIGLHAARQMRAVPGVRLIVGARRPQIELETLLLDLTRLASVRSFASAVETALSDDAVDVLVLNAGMQFGDVKHRTEDGFETTFAVNHLAHYLLLRLLMPRLAHGATVVLTTSNLHDPRTNSVAPPEHADAIRLARGQVELGETQSARASLRAYATSKLCNMLTARFLASSAFARDRELKIIAFNPGFTPGTGLTRHQSVFFRIPFRMIVSVLSAVQRMNTVEGGGAHLSDLALGRLSAPSGRIYASQVKRLLTWPDPSGLASDDTVMEKLWLDSAAMVGLFGAE